MEVSRPYIKTDEIELFPIQDRFLKLPIENYLNLIDIQPVAPQIALVNAINDPRHRYVTACLSRRTGKTFISNIIAQLVALVPGTNVLLVSPNYQLSTISWDIQRQLINKFDVEVSTNNKKDRVITLKNESSIRMGAISQVDSLVGRSYDLILFDEAALCEDGESKFNIQLRPTLDKDNSKAIFISTPRGIYNFFHDFYQRGFDPNHPEWASIHATWKDNPRMTDENVAEAKNTMSAAEFDQEFNAKFTVFEGRVWDFDFENCIKDLSELDFRDMDVIGGIDVGFRDPTALCVIAYDHDTEMYYALAEYMDNESTTRTHAERILELEEQYGIDMIFIDAAAAQTRFDWAQEYDLSTVNAKKSVLDGIAAVGRIVDDKRLIVDKNCTEILRSLDQYSWKQDSNLEREKPIHSSACHMADALRYAIYSYVV
jgi:phage terminase large subunit